MKLLDRILAALLILGGIGHAIGSFNFYRSDPMTLLWALCFSLFAFLLAALHLLRIARPPDRAVALLCLGGTLCLLCLILAFGRIIHSFADPRVAIQAIVAGTLCATSWRTLQAAS